MKNPQTTIALTFLSHIISGIDGVKTHQTHLGQHAFSMKQNYILQHNLYHSNFLGYYKPKIDPLLTIQRQYTCEGQIYSKPFTVQKHSDMQRLDLR